MTGGMGMLVSEDSASEASEMISAFPCDCIPVNFASLQERQCLGI